MVQSSLKLPSSSIYIWKERALAALREALEPHKRGPKFKHLQKRPDKNTKSLRENR